MTNVPRVRRIVGTTLILVLAGCSTPTLVDRLKDVDSEIYVQIKQRHWMAAEQMLKQSMCNCAPEEKEQVESWREREKYVIMSEFAKSLVPEVEKAKRCFKGETPEGVREGDEIRRGLHNRYLGGDVKVEETISKTFEPCVRLAMAQIQSDKSLAAMTARFSRLRTEAEEVDVSDGSRALQRLEKIADEMDAADGLKTKVDVFMTALDDAETRKWAQINRTIYSGSIKEMEKERAAARSVALRKKWDLDVVARKIVYKETDALLESGDYQRALLKLSRLELLVPPPELKGTVAFQDDLLRHRWKVMVAKRKHEYVTVKQMIDEGNFQAALQTLGGQPRITPPEGVDGCVEYNDDAERANVATGELGVSVAKDLLEAGTVGVQYHRDDEDDMVSVLVVGRAPISGDAKEKRNIRKAVTAARLQAQAEFARFMGTKISASRKIGRHSKNGKTEKEWKSVIDEEAKMRVSGLVLVATGVRDGEAVVIYGWRNAAAGAVTPSPMRRVENVADFTVSPSIGAYL